MVFRTGRFPGNGCRLCHPEASASGKQIMVLVKGFVSYAFWGCGSPRQKRFPLPVGALSDRPRPSGLLQIILERCARNDLPCLLAASPLQRFAAFNR